MPRSYEMSWEGAPKYRWVKMFKGTRYRVTCEELGAMVWTAEGSYRLANEWWRKKLAELTQPHPTTATLDRHEIGDLKEVIARGEAAKAMLTLKTEDPGLRETFYTPKLHDHIVASVAAKLEPEMVPPDRALSKLAERFLAVEQARGKAAGTFGDLAYYVRKIQTDCPLLRSLDASTINEATVTDFYTWLRNQSGQVPAVQKKLWGYFRRLVRFVAGQRLCPIPVNLDDRIFSFEATAKKIKTYSVEKVRAMLANLPDRLKLYAHLALNCGMYGVDMAMLRHEELADGRITRKRTKTRNAEDVPTVEYVLWPETLALLAKFPSQHSEYVLTSATGTPLWRDEIRGGKRSKTDLVHVQWNRGRGEGRATKPPIPLKALRSVAATILEGHKDYGRFTSLFLGHSPASIKDKHYAAPPQALFDEAILWLRGQILGHEAA